MSMGRRAAFGSLAVAALLVGCGQISYEPEPVDWKTHTASPAAHPVRPSPSPSSSPSAGESFDVCGLVSPERMQQIFAKSKPPTIGDEPDQSPPQIPGAGLVSRCTYRWGDSQISDVVTVAVMPRSGQADPKAFVALVIGPTYERVSGVGPAGTEAAVDRTQRFGNDVGVLVAAKKSSSGTAGLLVLGPLSAKDGAYKTLGSELLATLP